MQYDNNNNTHGTLFYIRPTLYDQIKRGDLKKKTTYRSKQKRHIGVDKVNVKCNKTSATVKIK